MNCPLPTHLTIHPVAGRLEVLADTPYENGLSSFTAAHSFKIGDEEVIWWTVDCDLTGEQIRAIALEYLNSLK